MEYCRFEPQDAFFMSGIFIVQMNISLRRHHLIQLIQIPVKNQSLLTLKTIDTFTTLQLEGLDCLSDIMYNE